MLNEQTVHSTVEQPNATIATENEFVIETGLHAKYFAN